MLSYMTHYKNKYPGGLVRASEDSIDVYDKNGDHAVALRKNGAGQWVDRSSEFGCKDSHCLAPIPKDSRVHKVQDGKLGLSEEAEIRYKEREKYLCSEKRRVLSIEELSKQENK